MYKYKIYTPNMWRSYFNHYPYLIVDDDGLIYTEEDYNKVVKPLASGKIDFSTGKIYGADYYKFGATQIGKFQKNGDVFEIYGEDYYKLGAKPIIYIKDNQVYTYDEYFRLWGTPSAFVEQSDNSATEEAQHNTTHKTSTTSSINSNSSSSGGTAFGIIALIALISFPLVYGMVDMQVKYDKTSLYFEIFSAFIGCMCTCYFMRKYSMKSKSRAVDWVVICFFTEILSATILYIALLISDISNGVHSGLASILVYLVLGVPVMAITMIPFSLIFGTIAFLLFFCFV